MVRPPRSVRLALCIILAFLLPPTLSGNHLNKRSEHEELQPLQKIIQVLVEEEDFQRSRSFSTTIQPLISLLNWPCSPRFCFFS